MCTDRHGGSIARRGLPRGGARALLALAFAGALLVPWASHAADPPRDHRVVWTGGDRLYVASADSGAIATGMVVHVLDRGREIATGTVTGVLDGAMASVRLTAGSVASNQRLDRLELRLDPAPARATPALRIGLPAPSRSGLAFSCADARLDLAALPRAYRAETIAVERWRLLAGDSSEASPMWPETLFVRMFGDRADEEIALERGELDLAVFWPGEPSARLRQGTSGYETLLGDRARGVMAGVVAARDSLLPTSLDADMEALNAEMFGGDLDLWAGPVVATVESAGEGSGARYLVDASIPGQRPIERFLERRRGALSRPDDPAIRLVYLDVPVAPRDSLESAWSAQGAFPLFTMRCPEICRADLAEMFRSLDVDAFANLLQCRAGRSTP